MRAAEVPLFVDPSSSQTERAGPEADLTLSEASASVGTRHFGGLDGIRAFAVMSVLLFHFGVSGFPGGMLGVDVFFALSGFLITSLLVEEHRRTGSIRLLGFYGRRARRLLPALFLTLLLVAAYAIWFAESDTLAQIRSDALATLGYVANWWYVVAGQGYFVQTGPQSPLLHTWSLAVEEQFYLFWPLVSLLVLKRWGTRALAVVAGAGAVASVVLTVSLQHAGFSSDRLYYGTDTRAQAILVGALLAALGPASAHTRRPIHAGPGLRRVVITLWALAGAAWIGWAVHSFGKDDPLLYEGGFLYVAVATAGLIAVSVTEPQNAVSRVLSWGPITYVGKISYGLYLYHWPISLMVDDAHTGLLGWHLLAARLGVTFTASVASYHLVELPIRERRFLRGRKAAYGAVVGLGAVLASVIGATVAVAAPPLPQSARASMAVPSAAASARFLAAAGLAPGHTVNALVLGDSLGLTLGIGLSDHSSAWGVTVQNDAVLGCDLDPDSTIDMQQGPAQAAQGCAHWLTQWPQEIAKLNPDVVAIELGRWEVSDRLVDGRWTRIGEPLWDNLLAKLLNHAIDVASARGAKVVMFNLPYVKQTTEAPNGQPWEINQPARTNEYNAVLAKVVAEHPGVASIIDLNKLLDPRGHYTSFVDGVEVRNPDEEHPSIAGGELLRPVILPQLLTAGLAHEKARTSP
jgi:peptidoglycan/LPS O-acetylase OafA/YrhL